MAADADLQPPTWMDGTTVPAADLRRQITGSLLTQAGRIRGLSVQALAVPAMQVRVTAGTAAVDDGQGGYYVADLPEDAVLDIAASSSSLPRRDAVILSMLDEGTTADNRYRVRVITGTPAASPSLPTLPPADEPDAAYEHIATVYVRANAETDGYIRDQDITSVGGSAGGQTDWVPISLPAGVEAHPDYGETPAVRWLLPGIVQVRGTLRLTSGEGIPSGTLLGTVPAGYRPRRLEHWATAAASSALDRTARPQVGASGEIISYHGDLTPDWISLRGILYEIED